MPVAFHSPVEHPVEAPQPTRAADDSGNGEMFAALLADAGKSTMPVAPGVVTDAGKTPPVPVHGGNQGDDTDRHKIHDGDAAFDPLSAFAAWPGAQAAVAGLSLGATQANANADPGTLDASLTPASRGAARPPAGDALPLPAASALIPDTKDAAGARSIAAGADADSAHPAPVHGRPAGLSLLAEREATDASAHDAKATDTDAATSPFATASALLARTSTTVKDLSAPLTSLAHRDGPEPAPPVNLGATAATTAPAPAYPIAQPVGTPGFATEVAGQIAQLVHINTDRAQLHVHPADMGPIDVTMQVRHDQVSVTMVAADPHTRAALELALPQLRDLLANQGLALTNASVNDQAPRDQGAASQNGGASARSGTPAIAAAGPAAAAPSGLMLRRLVDLYA